MIPVEHAAVAHERIPGSRLEIFENAGHFPHLEEPGRFARLLMDFVKNTDPAEFEFTDEDLGLLRERMLARAKRSP